MKDEQYYVDERAVIWGERSNDCDQTVPILPRGHHQFPFRFHIPETNLPCSFESRACYIRYYVKVCIIFFYFINP